jgi:hypothetical protein
MLNPKWKKVKVTEDKKSLDVYIPEVEDRSEAKDLMDFAIGKTKDDLRHKEIFNRNKKPADPAEAKAVLKESQEFNQRKSEGRKRFY